MLVLSPPPLFCFSDEPECFFTPLFPPSFRETCPSPYGEEAIQNTHLHSYVFTVPNLIKMDGVFQNVGSHAFHSQVEESIIKSKIHKIPTPLLGGKSSTSPISTYGEVQGEKLISLLPFYFVSKNEDLGANKICKLDMTLPFPLSQGSRPCHLL